MTERAKETASKARQKARVPATWPFPWYRPTGRRGSASDLVSRFRRKRAELRYAPEDVRFKLECFDLDEALCVMERLTDAERRVSFVTWMRFPP